MLVTELPTESLIPYAANPRKNDSAVDSIAASIKQFGFKQPIVVDADNVIVVGHTRLKAAQKLGLKKVPVVRADDLTPDQIKAYRIIDNKTNELAEWEPELLQLELDGIEMSLDEFGVEFEDDLPEPEVSLAEDVVPDVPVDVQTKSGDLWLLGQHRVLCGDCTNEANTVFILGEQRASLIVTDPPYGVNHIGGTKDPRRKTHRTGGVVTNDDLGVEGTSRLVSSALNIAAKHTEGGSSAYIACPPGTLLPHFIAAMADSFEFMHSLVWVKNAFVFGRADYHYRHELILYGWKKDAAHYFTRDRTKDSVFEFDRGDPSVGHPTSKPIGLFGEFIANSSVANQIVYDPFLGSGTTLIAAHRLNRICYGLEIEPKYCDVICQRFYNETGIIPKTDSGKTFIPIENEQKTDKSKKEAETES